MRIQANNQHFLYLAEADTLYTSRPNYVIAMVKFREKYLDSEEFRLKFHSTLTERASWEQSIKFANFQDRCIEHEKKYTVYCEKVKKSKVPPAATKRKYYSFNWFKTSK